MSEKKEVKKAAPKESAKTREQIEEMFSFDFSCDCSHCSHKCGDEK